MIDYFFKFPDQATAIAAAPADFYRAAAGDSPAGWDSSQVLPNIQAWRLSQDVGNVHTFLAGWFVIISLPNKIAAMLSHPDLQFALDRDACNALLPFVVKNNIGAIISDVACTPMLAGSNYPIGGYA